MGPGSARPSAGSTRTRGAGATRPRPDAVDDAWYQSRARLRRPAAVDGRQRGRNGSKALLSFGLLSFGQRRERPFLGARAAIKIRNDGRLRPLDDVQQRHRRLLEEERTTAKTGDPAEKAARARGPRAPGQQGMCSCGVLPILSALCASASRATSTSRRWRHAPRHRRDAPRRCCTCSKQFPHRRMNGAPVKSYDDLVSYLLAKDPRIRKARLDFEGRNACLYFRP